MSALVVVGMLVIAFGGSGGGRAQARRLSGLRDRHSGAVVASEASRSIVAGTAATTGLEGLFTRLLPNPALLQKRLNMTGKDWTVGKYGMASGGIALIVMALMMLKGMPLIFGLLVGVMLGGGVPHFAVNFFIKRRIAQFTAKFPDAIELLVRGLRSGLPITETITVVGNEVAGPVGEEFRLIADRMKIGRTMDASLQETADRLGTPEFQFFVITIAIQRETGGNLAETLANLATVLRQRSQMKLKIKAMSSESKASAYIVGSLPFIVFALIYMISGDYMQNFFVDPRLIIAGLGGLVWMGIGAFIMAKMVNFEI